MVPHVNVVRCDSTLSLHSLCTKDCLTIAGGLVFDLMLYFGVIRNDREKSFALFCMHYAPRKEYARVLSFAILVVTPSA